MEHRDWVRMNPGAPPRQSDLGTGYPCVLTRDVRSRAGDEIKAGTRVRVCGGGKGFAVSSVDGVHITRVPKSIVKYVGPEASS